MDLYWTAKSVYCVLAAEKSDASVAIVGFDLGRRIGCSFILGGRVMELTVCTRTSDAVNWMNELISRYRPSKVIIKLGKRYSRGFLRVLSKVNELPTEMLLMLVDESGTTKVGKGAGVSRHKSSALNIALMAGELRLKRKKDASQ